MPDTKPDAELIERVVQEVIRRLLERGLAVAPQQPSSGCQEVRLPDKVVTLATLDGKLAGARRLVVGPRAVVTPAVKDELKDKGIELVRG